MKRIALVVAVFALAACARQDDAAVADTEAMAPAPVAVDTTQAPDSAAVEPEAPTS